MIFDKLSNYKNYNSLDSLNEILNAIANQKRKLNLTAPFSLVELNPDENDYNWLLNWVDNLEYDFVKKCLRHSSSNSYLKWTYREFFGLMILFLFSEILRRKDKTGGIWKYLESNIRLEIRNLLFNSNNYPNSTLNISLEEGSRKIGLHHAFDLKDTQSWYTTIFLQIGFSIEELKRNLPLWLSGYNEKDSIIRLRECSNSFKSLWSILENYRYGNLNREQTNNELKNSPWILENYTDDILKACKDKPEYTKRDNNSNDSEIAFLSKPKLIIGNETYFEIKIINISTISIDFDENDYDLFIGNQKFATISKNLEGYYEFSINIIKISNESFSNNIIATIKSKNGIVIKNQEINLIDLDDDITLFDSSGKKLDAYNDKLDKSKEYILVFSNDLEINCDKGVQCLSIKDYKVYKIFPNWSNLEILIEGDVLWESFYKNNITLNKTKENYGFIITDKTVNEDNQIIYKKLPKIFLNSYNKYSLYITKNGEFIDDIKYIRAFNEFKEFYLDSAFKNNIDSIIIENFVLSNFPIIDKIKFIIKYENDNKITKLEFKNNQIYACYFYDNNDLILLSKDSKISVEKLKTSVFRFLIPEVEKDKYLVEGFANLESFKKLSNKNGIRNLSGYGQPLLIQSEFYNSSKDDKLLVISNNIVNYGIAKDINFKDDNLIIEFSNKRELGDEKIVFWNPSYFSDEYNLKEITTIENNKWIINIPLKERDISCFYITLNNYKIVSGWKDNILEELKLFFSTEKKKTVIEILEKIRYLNLPICNYQFKSLFREILDIKIDEKNIYLVDFINTWVLDSEEENKYDNQETWFSAIREIFWNYSPKSEIESNFILENLLYLEKYSDETRLEIIFNILNFDPLLFFRIISKLNKTHAITQLLNKVKSLIEGTYNNLNLLNETASSIGLDNAFIKSTYNKSLEYIKNNNLDPLDKGNLRRLLSNKVYRDYITHSLILDFLR